MSILVLESNRAQAETIRHIVCNVLCTELTLVDSMDDALQALRVTTPDLLLLPALVSPAEEAKLVTFLRKHPKGAHVETLITPIIDTKKKKTESSTHGWLRWPSHRTESDVSSVDAATVFTERLTWSLHRAAERRRQDGDVSAAQDGVDERNMSSEAVAPPPADEEIAPEAVAEAPILDVAEEPVRSSPASHADRRTHQRFHAHELQALSASRLIGGSLVNVRDVSAGGALLESDRPLEADFGVLEFITDMLHARYVPFRVVRHQVETHGSLTRFVEACAFLEPLDVSELQGRKTNTDAHAADAGISTLKAALESYLTGPASAERRRHVRVNGPFDGCRRGLIDRPVLILNLSEGGCFVDSRLEVDAGRQLTLGLRTVDEEWIDVAAEVVHNQPGIGFAVRFVETSDTIRDGLARTVAARTLAEARKTTTA